jgi:hypothetical protein
MDSTRDATEGSDVAAAAPPRDASAGRPGLRQVVLRRLKDPFTYHIMTAVASVVGALASTVGLLLLWMTIASSLKVAQAEQNMSYSDRLQKYNDLQQHLIKGGKWFAPGAGPQTDAEWFEVHRYMGLLEHMQVLLSTGVLTIEVADSQLSHRVYALYRNKRIRSDTIIDNPEQWRNFRKVLEQLQRMPSFQALQRRSPPEP